MVTRVGVMSSADRPAWDSVAQSGHHFMQTWAWSEFKELEGYSVLRLGVWDDARLTGGGLFYGFKAQHEGELWASPGGPLLNWQQPAEWEALLRAFRQSPETRRAVVLRLEPLLEALPPALSCTIRAPSDLFPDQTLDIDLGTEDEMLARMRPKGRYNARLAARHGVDVSFSTNPSDIHDLYAVLEQTARYQNFLLEPRSTFVNLAASLLPASGEMVFARFHGMTLAAAFVVRCGDTLTYLYGGHLPIFSNRMAAYALHWEIMKRAALDGLKHYDLYGYVGGDQPTHPYFGFSRFKEKLGGVPRRRIGSRDIIFYDRLADVALSVLGAVK